LHPIPIARTRSIDVDYVLYKNVRLRIRLASHRAAPVTGVGFGSPMAREMA
jgi:hypothetical protein